MDFYELEAFVTLSRVLHFGRAAAKINLSPSALSRMIDRLETETGCILLDRSNRQVNLTEDGRIFAGFAKEMLDRQNDLNFQLSKDKDRVSGTLHVYASVTACYTVLPQFIKLLAKKYPYIQLSVETGDPAGALQAVREGRAALAVDAIPDDGYTSMETISVFKTPLVFAAAADGPYTKITGSPQDIVSSVPLVLPKAGLARERFDKWTKSRNVHPIIAAETEGNEAILAIAQLGLGIGLVPRIVLESGPYKSGFVIHAAGNALGYYNVGFIRRTVITGTQSERRIQEAAGDILHTTQWSTAE
jgi:LysR family transcriptional regulator, positive regulator for ilvC